MANGKGNTKTIEVNCFIYHGTGNTAMSTRVVVFPFDLFGNSGASEGARILADEIREILRDSFRETVTTRALAWRDHIRLREISLDNFSKLKNWRLTASKCLDSINAKNQKFIWLGGNHLACLPVYDHLCETNTLVLQFDAHLDIHHFDNTLDTPSHGNFVLFAKRPLLPIVNVGHREQLLTKDHIDTFFQDNISAIDIAVNPELAFQRIMAIVNKAERIFIDIDCDVMDAAFFPATGRPVPMGLTPMYLTRIMEAIDAKKIVGVGISEFDPSRDDNDRSLALLIWWVERFFLRWYE